MAYLLWAWFQGAPTAVPFAVAVIAVGFAAAVLLLPRLVGGGRSGPTVDVALQLKLGEIGHAAIAKVERVDYARLKTRAGYRDGTTIDMSAGNAHVRFAVDGGERSCIVEFSSGEPALKDGDEVTMLYDPSDPSNTMPLRALVDIELRVVPD